MNRLTQRWLADLDRALKHNAEAGTFSSHVVLAALRQLGFTQCLFYDAAPNLVSKDYQIILSAIDGDLTATHRLGQRIDFKESAIGRLFNERGPVIQSATAPPVSQRSQQLCLSLNISHLNRIHTPLYDGVHPIGAITCAWDGALDLVADEHIAGLATLASLYSRYWTIGTNVLVSNLVAKIQGQLTPRSEKQDLDRVLAQFAELALDAMNGGAAAIFQYNWYSGLLLKNFEHVRSERSVARIGEEYPVGEKVSGRAWKNADERHIVDFPAYRSQMGREVNEDSVGFHSAALGGVHTILYVKLGVGHERYMLRIINRNQKEGLPFFTSHKIALDRIAQEVSHVLDEHFISVRLRALQDVARTAVTNITDPAATIRVTARALANDYVAEFFLLARRTGDARLGHLICSDPTRSSRFERPTVSRPDPLLDKLADTQEVSTVAVTSLPGVADIRHLIYLLNTERRQFITIVPFESGTIQGWLLIPCPSNTVGSPSEVTGRLPKEHREALSAYASLLASCLATEDSYLTAESAKRLIAQIGHEVHGPVARLGQKAVEAIVEMMNMADSRPGERECQLMLTKLDAMHDDIGNKMQEISTVMEGAVQMAQGGHGDLQVHFAEFDLVKVIKDAVAEVQATTVITDAREREYAYEFNFNRAFKDSHRMVGDRGLLLKALANVVKNAVKYSLPPGKNEPISVDLVLIPQSSWHILQIRNWGIRVPEELGDRIFSAFVRGDLKDRLKARRGMGLGLYIARWYISAHKGEIACISCESTFNDPVRRNVEGWTTTFEIRLPRNLIPGTHDFSR